LSRSVPYSHEPKLKVEPINNIYVRREEEEEEEFFNHYKNDLKRHARSGVTGI